ncbi:Oxoglutarate 3-dioxygenase [Favolaschia claudopus]|uniref:Oxoglutarate 3-dioxygenase n=1 Tax=Favolaschia claudopus TaxID=2862362 RepID=A0AAW0D6W6_9AGAR
MSLPVINIAPWLAQNTNVEARKTTSEALHSACLDYGFFYLDISEFVDPSVPEELTTLARKFFALPQGEKDKISLSNQDYARGYQRLKENVTNGKADNHEGLDFYRPVENPDKSRPLWGENQFPDAIPGFREKYEAWVQKMKALGLIVMEAMAVGLGMTTDEWLELRSQVDDSFWVMRAIGSINASIPRDKLIFSAGYPPLPNDSDGFSCGAHKDYGCLTFLYADPTPSALQVFLRQNGSIPVPDTSGLPAEQGAQQGIWINADPIPGCVVCNIGEMFLSSSSRILMLVSNHWKLPNVYKAMMPSLRSRQWSMATFSWQKLETTLQGARASTVTDPDETFIQILNVTSTLVYLPRNYNMSLLK